MKYPGGGRRGYSGQDPITTFSEQYRTMADNTEESASTASQGTEETEDARGIEVPSNRSAQIASRGHIRRHEVPQALTDDPPSHLLVENKSEGGRGLKPGASGGNQLMTGTRRALKHEVNMVEDTFPGFHVPSPATAKRYANGIKFLEALSGPPPPSATSKDHLHLHEQEGGMPGMSPAQGSHRLSSKPPTGHPKPPVEGNKKLAGNAAVAPPARIQSALHTLQLLAKEDKSGGNAPLCAAPGGVSRPRSRPVLSKPPPHTSPPRQSPSEAGHGHPGAKDLPLPKPAPPVQDNGYLEVVPGVRYAIPPFYDDLARLGQVPSMEEVALDEEILTGPVTTETLKSMQAQESFKAQFRKMQRAQTRLLQQLNRQRAEAAAGEAEPQTVGDPPPPEPVAEAAPDGGRRHPNPPRNLQDMSQCGGKQRYRGHVVDIEQTLSGANRRSSPPAAANRGTVTGRIAWGDNMDSHLLSDPPSNHMPPPRARPLPREALPEVPPHLTEALGAKLATANVSSEALKIAASIAAEVAAVQGGPAKKRRRP